MHGPGFELQKNKNRLSCSLPDWALRSGPCTKAGADWRRRLPAHHCLWSGSERGLDRRALLPMAGGVFAWRHGVVKRMFSDESLSSCHWFAPCDHAASLSRRAFPQTLPIAPRCGPSLIKTRTRFMTCFFDGLACRSSLLWTLGGVIEASFLGGLCLMFVSRIQPAAISLHQGRCRHWWV